MNDLICVTAVEGEPRVLDTELAAALGYALPAQIRELIKRHEAPLSQLGVIRTVRKTSGAQSGRPATAYYLNKPQAVFLTTQAGTPTAVAVTVQVIQKFDAYERGLIQAAPAFRVPQTFAEALRLAADECGLSGAAVTEGKSWFVSYYSPQAANISLCSPCLRSLATDTPLTV